MLFFLDRYRSCYSRMAHMKLDRMRKEWYTVYICRDIPLLHACDVTQTHVHTQKCTHTVNAVTNGLCFTKANINKVCMCSLGGGDIVRFIRNIAWLMYYFLRSLE